MNKGVHKILENSPIWLAGYDNRGKVYIGKDYIEREVYPEYTEDVLTILDLYNKNNLSKIGIVQTSVNEKNQKLRHKKHPISYPFEWSANMYKDAVLFHLNLFLQLDHYELVLKDALPNNIVFDYYKPIFIDFLSILQKKDLIHEAWLMRGKQYKEPIFAVFDAMFEQYMLVPFMAMAEKKYGLSRLMLSEQSCNCGDNTPCWKDIYYSSLFRQIGWIKNLMKHFIKKLLTKYSEFPKYHRNPSRLFSILSSKQKLTFIDFCIQLIRFVEATDVTPPISGYLSYYDSKNENFDFHDQSCWKTKQKVVVKIMELEKPKTIIDIGSNTGWFSIVAALRGIRVVATDNDESSTDKLYLYSQKNRLQILPLFIPFDKMRKQIFGKARNSSTYKDRDFKSSPLYLPATKRFKSDMVLCLGLLHHLVIGNGMSINDVIDILSELSIKTLVLEYIDLQDPLIQDKPSFFKNIGQYSDKNYNIEIVIAKANNYFNSCDVFDSHPATRKLLLLKKL